VRIFVAGFLPFALNLSCCDLYALIIMLDSWCVQLSIFDLKPYLTKIYSCSSAASVLVSVLLITITFRFLLNYVVSGNCTYIDYLIRWACKRPAQFHI
jgi:hypothetical protein